MKEEDLKKYEKNYSKSSLWAKLKKIALKIGKPIITKVLELYYALERKDLPVNIKATIYGALGYFILPIDFIPDIIPVVGYSDDLIALSIALKVASDYIDDNVRKKVKQKLKDWFNDDDDNNKDTLNQIAYKK